MSLSLAQKTNRLTDTELNYVFLASQGLSNFEIAGIYGIVSTSIKKRLTFAYRKLGVSGRGRAALSRSSLGVGV